MHNTGINLVGKENHTVVVKPDETGFIFSFDDQNTLQWILNGFVDAGATDDCFYEKMFSYEVRANLVELARTDFVPRQVVVASPQIETQLVKIVWSKKISENYNEWIDCPGGLRRIFTRNG